MFAPSSCQYSVSRRSPVRERVDKPAVSAGAHRISRPLFLNDRSILDPQQIAARGGPPQGERAWFSWLPTFHDMGLIQGTLAPFVCGWSAAYCSPVTFLRRPLIWLELMSKERSQITAAPDFAFRLCVRKW